MDMKADLRPDDERNEVEATNVMMSIDDVWRLLKERLPEDEYFCIELSCHRFSSGRSELEHRIYIKDVCNETAASWDEAYNRVSCILAIRDDDNKTVKAMKQAVEGVENIG